MKPYNWSPRLANDAPKSRPSQLIPSLLGLHLLHHTLASIMLAVAVVRTKFTDWLMHVMRFCFSRTWWRKWVKISHYPRICYATPKRQRSLPWAVQIDHESKTLINDKNGFRSVATHALSRSNMFLAYSMLHISWRNTTSNIRKSSRHNVIGYRFAFPQTNFWSHRPGIDLRNFCFV